MPACMVKITVGSPEEAMAIATDLVERRLASSVNIVDSVRSIYRWRGQIRSAQEAMLLAKTRTDLVDDVVRRVDDLHSYEVPCVVSLPIDAGHADYLDWIDAETAESEVGG